MVALSCTFSDGFDCAEDECQLFFLVGGVGSTAADCLEMFTYRNPLVMFYFNC